MKLAVLDNEGNVLVTFPDAAGAHADIGDAVAAAVFPGRFDKSKRDKTATAIRTYLAGLQQQTVRL